jgi:hypothetical protein
MGYSKNKAKRNKTPKKAVKPELCYELCLVPYIGLIDQCDEVSRVTLGAYALHVCKDEQVLDNMLASSACLDIVHMSMNGYGKVAHVEYDAKSKVYTAKLVCKDYVSKEELEDDLWDNYGDLASDGWMEGDILVGLNQELHLELRDLTCLSDDANCVKEAVLFSKLTIDSE